MKTWIYNESLLIYIWQLLRFDTNELQTTEGQKIIIQNKGFRNNDAGPDFENVRLIIDDTNWIGTIEIHWFSSDWYLHQHEDNPSFNNVILHVVFEEDKIIYNQNGNRIPCLELKNRIHPDILNRTSNLNPNNWIPCEKLISSVNDFTKTIWLERLVIERLENKTKIIHSILLENNWNWEEGFYILLCKYLGGPINSEPFETLAKQTPFTILLKNKDDQFILESILFGQSGLLISDKNDEYIQKLTNEYQYQSNKFKLKPIQKHLWKFLRLRPANFPTLRIAELAALIYKNGTIFRKVIECEDFKSLYQLFSITLSPYWDNHYVFGENSKTIVKKLGKSEINTLIINTIIPFLYFYAKQKNDDKLMTKAFEWLNQLPVEKNQIISKWKDLGFINKSASESQALIQLYKNYCMKQKCLECSIGHSIINPTINY